MKRLLFFLVLIVGTAPAANAMTLQFQQGGTPTTLDIVATAGYTMGDDIYFCVVADTSYVTITGGSVGAVAPADTGIYGNDAQLNGMCEAPLDGMWGFIGNIAGGAAPTGTYIDEIDVFLVGGILRTPIYLNSTTDFVNFITLDFIPPEPATLFLLGLGALMLRRKRR
jgi:hypothetical protein